MANNTGGSARTMADLLAAAKAAPAAGGYVPSDKLAGTFQVVAANGNKTTAKGFPRWGVQLEILSVDDSDFEEEVGRRFWVNYNLSENGSANMITFGAFMALGVTDEEIESSTPEEIAGLLVGGTAHGRVTVKPNTDERYGPNVNVNLRPITPEFSDDDLDV